MSTIVLRGLDKDKLCRWIKTAEDNGTGDPVYSFIAAWIGFNYYYSTFAFAEDKKDEGFKIWSNSNFHGSKGDKAQWSFLIQHSSFESFFNNFKKQNKKIFGVSIKLPIVDMLKGEFVPKDRTGEIKLEELSTLEIFEILYQIRNNLFHGDKDPKKNERDLELSTFACRFALPFLRNLNTNTFL
jgi:hypothetical protein